MWSAPLADESQEDKMKVERMVLGQIQTNCYFAINEATKETIVIDPADRPDSVLRKAVDEGLTLKAIFLTHGHADHMLGVPELKAKLGIPVYACEAEKALLADPAQNLSPALFRKSVSFAADVWVKDGQELEVAGMKFRVYGTPGHTPGGCCYYSAEAGVLFSGDTLFAGSVGRTDFPGGSMSALVRGIKEKLTPLPDETKVYPGHMEESTIGAERRYNPYLGG